MKRLFLALFLLVSSYQVSPAAQAATASDSVAMSSRIWEKSWGNNLVNRRQVAVDGVVQEVSWGDVALLQAAMSNRYDFCKELLEKGAQPDVLFEGPIGDDRIAKRNAFDHAIAGGNLPLMELLLARARDKKVLLEKAKALIEGL